MPDRELKTEETQVLIVGGGLTGLTAAALLAERQVRTVVVERHAASSLHPRAIGFMQRTMEIFRLLRVAHEIPSAAGHSRPRRVRVESLAGKWFDEQEWTPTKDGEATKPAPKPEPLEYSPEHMAGRAQDFVEPVLRFRARELGADIRMSTTLTAVEQDQDAVTATLSGPHGEEYQIRADYAIAADGHRSPVREALGIDRDGRGDLRIVRSVLFRAPLEEYLERGFHQFSIENPEFPMFLTTYGDGRWLLMFMDDVERSIDEMRDAAILAIGRSDIDPEIITSGRWELSASIATKFSSGRIFLAGDAAHTLPPNRGGYGANTGIADAHNLAWKLEAVLDGVSQPSLLETYHDERRPVAWERHQQIFVRPDHGGMMGPKAAEASGVPILDDAAVEFGQLVRSTAVIGAGEDLPVALTPDKWAGQPGTRAPHAWVTVDGKRASTIDVITRQWAVFADEADDEGLWHRAAAEASRQLGIDVICLGVGCEVQTDDRESLIAAFGLEPGGASLVRPDGYVAWRSATAPADVAQALTNALAQVSSSVKRTQT